MTIAVYLLSAPLIAELVFGPRNLWTGRTIPNWTRFTGLSPAAARRVAAPVKLVGAVLLAVGLAVPAVGAAGAVVTLGVSVFYLVRLAHPTRRAADGIAAFSLFAVLAAALLAVQLAR